MDEEGERTWRVRVTRWQRVRLEEAGKTQASESSWRGRGEDWQGCVPLSLRRASGSSPKPQSLACSWASGQESTGKAEPSLIHVAPSPVTHTCLPQLLGACSRPPLPLDVQPLRVTPCVHVAEQFATLLLFFLEVRFCVPPPPWTLQTA